MKISIKRALLGAALLLALAVAARMGAHYYLEHQVDEWLAGLAPEVQVHYGRFHSRLSGQITLEGLRIQSPRLLDLLEIDELQLQGPSLATWLWQSLKGEGGLPSWASLRFRGARLSLAALPDGDGCDFSRRIPLQALTLLGIEVLQGEGEAHYRYLADSQRLIADLTFNLDQIERSRLHLRLRNVTPRGLRSGQLGAAGLELARLRFDLLPSLGRRLVSACAARLGVSEAAFEERLVTQLLAQLQGRGVAPGPDLAPALSAYVHDWGIVTLVLRPPIPLSLVFLPFVPQDQLQEKLGVELQINGRPVTGMRLGQWVARGAEPASRPTAPPAALRWRWLFEPIAPERLRRYLGYRVKLQARGDPARSGILLEVDGRRALVQQFVEGGYLASYVPLDRLEKAEVWVRRPVMSW